MGIYATKKWPSEGHAREWPDDIAMDETIRRMVDEKWDKYGI
jgi:4-hydroxy-3-polyprenylbenzoate decarboxylase